MHQLRAGRKQLERVCWTLKLTWSHSSVPTWFVTASLSRRWRSTVPFFVANVSRHRCSAGHTRRNIDRNCGQSGAKLKLVLNPTTHHFIRRMLIGCLSVAWGRRDEMSESSRMRVMGLPCKVKVSTEQNIKRFTGCSLRRHGWKIQLFFFVINWLLCSVCGGNACTLCAAAANRVTCVIWRHH